MLLNTDIQNHIKCYFNIVYDLYLIWDKDNYKNILSIILFVILFKSVLILSTSIIMFISIAILMLKINFIRLLSLNNPGPLSDEHCWQTFIIVYNWRKQFCSWYSVVTLPKGAVCVLFLLLFIRMYYFLLPHKLTKRVWPENICRNLERKLHTLK